MAVSLWRACRVWLLHGELGAAVVASNQGWQPVVLAGPLHSFQQFSKSSPCTLLDRHLQLSESTFHHWDSSSSSKSLQ